MGGIRKAFLLGAGLGTRLRPLTESLPKPLVPVWNRPLLSYALDHLIRDLAVEAFAVNTHHCAEAYAEAYPESRYRGRPILFRHEPVLLDTAGGIDNLRDWLPSEESFIVYNGDILTDLPLGPALAAHQSRRDLVTMILRSEGAERRVGFDEASGRVVDLRGLLAPDWPHRYQFTGIYLVSPAFLDWLRPGQIESVILPMVEAIRAGERIGGVVIDEGVWSDLGDRQSYLEALKILASGFPRGEKSARPCPRLSSEAEIAEGVEIDAFSSIGPGARVGEGASLKASVLWPGAIVEAGARLDGVVVRGGRRVEGQQKNLDF